MLERECAGDERLCRDVESLLANDRGGTTLIRDLVSEEAAALAAELEQRWVGRRLGAWRITGILGRGGMGAVYEVARDNGAFQQRAALKIVRAEVDRASTEESLASYEKSLQLRLAASGADVDNDVEGRAVLLSHVKLADVLLNAGKTDESAHGHVRGAESCSCGTGPATSAVIAATALWLGHVYKLASRAKGNSRDARHRAAGVAFARSRTGPDQACASHHEHPQRSRRRVTQSVRRGGNAPRSVTEGV